MLSIVGTYENGCLKLDKDYALKNPVKVIVTFLEAVESKSERILSLTDFSFAKSQEALQSYKGSFSDAVVEERRAEL